jgi:hypothetical protein
MRNLRCVIGRHDWQVKHDKEGQPYEICGRPRCYHIRGHDSRSDGPYRHQDSDLFSTTTIRCPLNQPTPVPASPAGEVRRRYRRFLAHWLRKSLCAESDSVPALE